jgi:hypothetical protein
MRAGGHQASRLSGVARMDELRLNPSAPPVFANPIRIQYDLAGAFDTRSGKGGRQNAAEKAAA